MGFRGVLRSCNGCRDAAPGLVFDRRNAEGNADVDGHFADMDRCGENCAQASKVLRLSGAILDR